MFICLYSFIGLSIVQETVILPFQQVMLPARSKVEKPASHYLLRLETRLEYRFNMELVDFFLAFQVVIHIAFKAPKQRKSGMNTNSP